MYTTQASFGLIVSKDITDLIDSYRVHRLPGVKNHVRRYQNRINRKLARVQNLWSLTYAIMRRSLVYHTLCLSSQDLDYITPMYPLSIAIYECISVDDSYSYSYYVVAFDHDPDYPLPSLDCYVDSMYDVYNWYVRNENIAVSKLSNST